VSSPAPSTTKLRIPATVRPWLGAVMISLSGVWVRLADVEVARSAFLRGAYALPVLVVLMVAARRRAPDRNLVRWLLPWAFIGGVLLGVDLVAWHAAIDIVGAGLGTVLPNMQVVFVGLAGVIFFRERPGVGFWVALPMVLGGIWILAVVGQPLAVDGSVPLGVLYGVIAAITYAGALVFLRVSRGRHPQAPSVAFLFSLTVGATAIMGVAAAGQGVAAPAGWPADGWLIMLAVGSQVVGWLLLTSSIHLLPAAATSVALLLQPVLALVWGRALLGEPLGLPQVAGAAVVLTGVVIAHRAVTETQEGPRAPGPDNAP
jgi:drug/metabolite transporter (DMT)-like permease